MSAHQGAIFGAALAALAGCMLPPAATPAPETNGEACPRLGFYEDRDSLLRALPELYAAHHRDLIVIGGSVYLSACSAEHLGGASESSRIGGAAEQSRLGSAGEDSRLGSAGENSRVASVGEQSRIGSAGEQSRIGSVAEQSRLGSAGESSRVGSAGEQSRLGSAGEDSRLGSAGEGSRLGSAGEGSRLGSAGESSRLAGGATVLHCKPCRSELGYELNTPSHRVVQIYDGVHLWRLVGGQLVDDANPPATRE